MSDVSSARISRWARRYLVASAGWLVLAQVAILGTAPRRVVITLGLYGFVLTTVFGKAYSLVPSYFDRSLAWSYAPAVQLPLTTGGVALLAAAGLSAAPTWLADAGAVVWTVGAGVFVTTMVATVRGNLTGRETGTGEANAERRDLDRLANAVVPLTFVYLLVGSYELVAATTPAPSPFGGLFVPASHLLGTGVATLMLFGVGYRLLPRFLVVSPSRRLAAVVLPLGAVGPVMLAWGYPAGPVFQAGAVAEAVAVVGFAVAYLRMAHTTDRDRVGFYGPLVGVLFGCLGVALGAHFAFGSLDATLGIVHRRVNVFGFLGLAIVGAVYQFYPPAVCPWPGGTDRTALVSIAAIAAGLTVAAVGAIVSSLLVTVGHSLALLGAVGYAYLLVGTLQYQSSRGG